MKILTPCKICSEDVALAYSLDQEDDPPIHPTCDERPAGEKNRPHPALGKATNLAFDVTLAMAEAQATPKGSQAWGEFDRLLAQLEQIDRNNTYPDLKWAALYYSQGLGWPVFPLRPGGKTPLTRNGFKDATTDRSQIEKWWSDHPDANIGLPTGHHFDVIDVDTPLSRTKREAMVGKDDFTALGLSITASGGYHFFVKPGELPVKNATGVMGQGIDYRTLGGYVVGAWSRMENGKPWRWIFPPSTQITNKP